MALSCPHFGSCGGCSLLEQPIQQQRAAKQEALEQQLGREIPWTDAGETSPRHDRLRILYPIQPCPEQGLRMGLYQRGSHELVEVESCEIQHPALTELGRRALRIFREQGVVPYDEGAEKGCLRAFFARLCPSTGELLIGLITFTRSLPGGPQLAQRLRDACVDLHPEVKELVGIVHNQNPEVGNVLIGSKERLLGGRGQQFDHVDGLELRVSLRSFYQLHRDSDALLYQPAMELAGQALGDFSGKRIIDAYGGVGTFACRFARRGVEAVQLIETNPAAVEDAKFNLSHNDLNKIEVSPEPFDKSPVLNGADLLVVDPSRAGLKEEGCAQALRIGAPHILYVSCGIPAFLRDLEQLAGYEVADACLADLFPHTEHAEGIFLLRKT